MAFYCRLVLGCLLLLSGRLPAQPTIYFNKVGVEQGLNDGGVEAVAQDKRGYIWASTLGGINCYNGKEVSFYDRVYSGKKYLPKSISRCIEADQSGNIYFGFENCLATFDYQQRKLVSIPAFEGVWIYGIFSLSTSLKFISANTGWFAYNPQSGKTTSVYAVLNDSAVMERPWAATLSGGTLYFTNRHGLFTYNHTQKKLNQYSLPDSVLGNILMAADPKGLLWIISRRNNQLFSFDPATRKLTPYAKAIGGNEFMVTDIGVHPSDGHIWIATIVNGLYRFEPSSGKLSNYRFNPFQHWTLNGNLVRRIFIDTKGLLWVAGDNGLSICNPNHSLFTIIPPFSNNTYERNRQVARVAAEDEAGNLWLGTTDGVSVLDSNFKQLAEYNNRPGQPDKVHYNSIRGIATDHLDRVWIATGKGINRYDKRRGKMEFLGAKDSLGNGFFFGAFKDNAGNIWFCSRDNLGLYYYDKERNQCFSIASHPDLHKLVGFGFRSLLQDSRGRYWIGLNGAGLAMYNPADHSISRWLDVPDSLPAIAGSYVCDIREDLNGKIWLSTFTGLSCVDPATKKVTNYTQKNGLISNTVGPLGVDSLNRIWIGTSRGLMMLDCFRKNFTVFDLNDGLPHLAFNEEAGYYTKKGEFIMATFNGYIRFNPLAYQPEAANIPVYITGIMVNKVMRHLPFYGKNSSPVRLPYYQNALSIHMEAPYFKKPGGAWFAYRLKGFEKDWHFSQTPFAEYTNLPGGNFVFEYKASENNSHWNIPVQTMKVSIGIVFYKTIWFWLLMALFLSGLLYRFYRQRLSRQEEVFVLQSKTQALEKEKAMVMYENLKQQLNPHFLFNSLTSLSSLIRIDQVMAGDFLDRMSKIYRYILKNRDSETVSVKDEIAFASHFIELQKTRFESGLIVNIEVGEEYLDRGIAPVTLQNLIENALKHNTNSKNKPLVIEVFAAGDYLVVRNSLQRKKFVETSNQQGLKSMQELYRYLSEKPMLVEEDERYFWVKIPLI